MCIYAEYIVTLSQLHPFLNMPAIRISEKGCKESGEEERVLCEGVEVRKGRRKSVVVILKVDFFKKKISVSISNTHTSFHLIISDDIKLTLKYFSTEEGLQIVVYKS